MTVVELNLALRAYRPDREVVVILEYEEERSFEIRSVDEITDTETGKSYVFLACAEMPR